MSRLERNCKVCGSLFETKNNRQLLCSEQCQKERIRECAREYQRAANWKRRAARWANELGVSVAERKMAEYFGIQDLNFETLRAALVGERRPEVVVVIADLFSVTYSTYCSEYGVEMEKVVMLDRAYNTEKVWYPSK